MPKLQDVAANAGVSISTVSRVLNGAKLSERISPDCVARVREAARKVGYTAGYHRRAIRLGKTETLGVSLERNAPLRAGEPALPSALYEPFINQMVAGVEQSTHAVGYNLSLVVPSHKHRATVRGTNQIYDGRIDGLVITPTNTQPENVEVLQQAPDLPIVAMMPAVPTELPSVLYEPAAAIELPVRHLVSLGHRHLLYFGPADIAPGGLLDRKRFFLDAAAAAGVEPQLCLYEQAHDPRNIGHWDVVEHQMSALETCLAQQTRRFTAIVCFNDMAAISACRVLQRHGLRVPADVSVTGIDNFNPAMLNPALTTVDARLVEMGARAGEIVLDMVNRGEPARQQYRRHREALTPRLIVRDSTAPPPAR